MDSIQVIYGNMFENVSPMTTMVVPANGKIREDKLIMGAGCALDAVNFFASHGIEIKYLSAMAIKLKPSAFMHYNNGMFELWEYYLARVFEAETTEFKVGLYLMQTKLDPSDRARYTLIEVASRILERIARKNPDMEYRLAFPGIGLGKLDPKGIKRYLKLLPDNVKIYRK